MRGKRTWALLVGAALLLTACTDSTPEPTLAPGTTAPVTTASTTTTVAPTTTATTSTTLAPTTTEDPDARFAEIQALAKDVYVGRLSAIYREDKSALLEWLGSQSAYDDAVATIDEGRLTFLMEPTHENVTLAVRELFLDRVDCVVVLAEISAQGVLDGATVPTSLIWVYWPNGAGGLLHGAVWQEGTPQSQWIEECDIATRGVTP